MVKDNISSEKYFESLIACVKECFTTVLNEKEKANNQRFLAQEEALNKADQTRNLEIKKSEEAIEKKSDAIYVKVGDLSAALAKIVPRKEIEERFRASALERKMLLKEITSLRNSRAESSGKSAGTGQIIMYLFAASGWVGVLFMLFNK